jgi:flagellar operon protein
MSKTAQINAYGQIGAPQRPVGKQQPGAAGQVGFQERLEQAGNALNLRFSNHAQKRLQTREICLSDDGLARLAEAVGKAEQRGGRESLVLMDELAFIVNVKERLVVTAMNAQKRGAGVFTQIDSVVLADPAPSAAKREQEV